MINDDRLTSKVSKKLSWEDITSDQNNSSSSTFYLHEMAKNKIVSSFFLWTWLVSNVMYLGVKKEQMKDALRHLHLFQISEEYVFFYSNLSLCFSVSDKRGFSLI